MTTSETAPENSPNIPEPNPEEIEQLAALFNQGRYPAAESCARNMTACFPEHGFGWKVLGALCQLQGRRVEALAARQQAVALMPEDAQAHNSLGVSLHECGRPEEAEAGYRRALAINPDYVSALCNLGITLHEQGRLEEAAATYRRALEISPEIAELHNNLGNTLTEMGRLEAAETCYQRALNFRPDYAEAHNNLGNIHKERGVMGDAEACYRRAVAIRPDYAEAHNNLGVTLKERGQLEAAAASYRRALESRPDYAEAHNNRGVTLRELGHLEDAESAYRSALVIKPDYAEALSNRGIVLKELGRLEEAEAECRRAVQIRPDHYPEAYSNLGNILKDQGRLAEAEACYRQALAIKPDFAAAHSNLLFTLNYGSRHDPACRLAEAHRYGQLVAGKVTERFNSWQCVSDSQRLRVGFVSGDLCSHPVGYFLENMLAHIDQSRCELIAYPTDSRADELTVQIRPHFSAWKPLVGLSDETAARLIHADGLHILLDLAGHTAHNRLPVFAWKPAPLQASWLGYFSTTGVAEMDYLLADEVGVPSVQREQFTETVCYLPDTRFCFSVPAVDLTVSELPALKSGQITFGCFQNMTKVSDGALAVWSKILAALPDARLRLQCKQLGNLQVVTEFAKRLRQQGIDPQRVSCHGGMVRESYLSAYGAVDLLLDTFPYPGGTTTCEGLWMGVPTLTLAGDSLLARQGASLLSAAGLAEWVAESEADYVAKAIAVAGDLPKLAALRAGLRQQVLASPLFDAARFARNFEAALWGMWEGWQNSH